MFSRGFLLLAALVATTGLKFLEAGPPSHRERPNILFIYTDDQSWRTLGCYGGRPWARTPNIDRLASEGVRFTCAYAGAWCAPSRATALTGLHPHGIRGLRMVRNPTSSYDPDVCRFWPSVLRRAGYTTAQIGKWHLSADTGFGRDWDHQVVWNHALSKQAGGYYTGQSLNIDGGPFQPKAGYSTDYFTDYAVRFVTRPHKKPWFLWLCYDAVHSPYTPAGRHRDLYPAVPVPIPGDVFGPRRQKPLCMRNYTMWERGRGGVPVRGKRDRRRTLPEWVRLYNRGVAAIDEGVGRLLESLDRTGQLDRTWIVYTSDQGFAWGEHGYAWKVGPYDPCMQVPMIIRMPGKDAVRDAVCARPMGLVDLIPTFFAAAKVPLPWKMHGHDLHPLLHDPRATWDHPVLLEQLGWAFGRETSEGITGDKSFPQHPWSLLLRRGKYKYVRWLVENEYEELYDLEADPAEQINLAAQSEHAGNLREFRRQLVAELQRTGADMANRLPQPNTHW